MWSLKQFNPASRFSGKLFAWFWVTVITSTSIAYMVGAIVIDPLRTETINRRSDELLKRVSNNLLISPSRQIELSKQIENGLKSRNTFPVVLDLDRKELLTGQLKPNVSLNIKDLFGALDSPNPVFLKRNESVFVGPVLFQKGEQRYALFLGRENTESIKTGFSSAMLIVAILSTLLLSLLFSRSLIKPIIELQRAAREIANGNWQARISLNNKQNDEIAQLGEDFNYMADKLDTMWSAQQRMLADISHELRSPIARIQMALGLAELEQVNPDITGRIELEVSRMESLIEQLLQLMKAETGNEEKHTLSVGELLHEVIVDARYEAKNAGKHIEISSLPDFNVSVNQTLISRAVENVLRNAIFYSATRVSVSFSAKNNYWSVIIEDDGQGLSSEEQTAIFRPFYRANIARERDSGGVGLGLAIAKGAIQIHQGSISAEESSLLGGLKVIIRLPVSLS